MLVFGTEMHIVTFIFAVLEMLMFFYQLTYYLSRPQDKGRYWYLILLSLLITYNVTGGLFPDPKLPIPIVLQNILAYGSGFVMASFFPYYFYKAFNLKSLRFHAIYGVFLFLITPYLVFFVVVYAINKNLDFAIKYGIIIPFIYSVVLLVAILKSIRKKYEEDNTKTNYLEMVAVYCACLPWVSISVIAYFHGTQLIEVLFTNFGFVVITIVFISRSIKTARLEYEQFQNAAKGSESVFLRNCAFFQLSTREIEVVQLIRLGMRYREIASKLFISEKTVSNHVQNIYEKVKVGNKTELVHRLTSASK